MMDFAPLRLRLPGLLPMIFLAFVSACSSGVSEGSGGEFYLGGIQVNEADHGRWIDNLKRAGMNTVAVTVYARQGDWDTAHLWYDEEAEWVVREIRAAKRAGMKVVFIPRVALDHAYERNEFLWHGMINPKTDEMLASWFEIYTGFLRKWAAVAEEEGVDVYAVGSEMNALASTVPLAELPALEEYFLNPEKQAREKEKMLAFADRVEAEHLSDHGAEGYASFEEYLDAKIAKNRGWAETVAGAGGAADLAEMNRRRRLLDEHWRRAIAAVREIYTGPLLYAANFDQFREVSFWDALDMIGINAYFPLRGTEPASEADVDADLDLEGAALYAALLRGWRGILGDLRTFRRQRGLEDHPVFFTELGYTWRANSTIHPWAGDGMSLVGPEGHQRLMVWSEQPEDFTERALALRALRAAHEEVVEESGAELLTGILYWKLSSHAYHHEVEPFVLVIGDGEEEPSHDPLLAELAAFGEPRRE